MREHLTTVRGYALFKSLRLMNKGKNCDTIRYTFLKGMEFNSCQREKCSVCHYLIINNGLTKTNRWKDLSNSLEVTDYCAKWIAPKSISEESTTCNRPIETRGYALITISLLRLVRQPKS